MTESLEKPSTLEILLKHWGPVLTLSALVVQVLTFIGLVTYLWSFDPDLAKLINLSDLSLTAFYSVASSAFIMLLYAVGFPSWVRNAIEMDIKWRPLKVVALMWPALFSLSPDMRNMWEAPDLKLFFDAHRILNWSTTITFNCCGAFLLLLIVTRDLKYYLFHFAWSSVLCAMLIGALMGDRKRNSSQPTHVIETNEKSFDEAKIISALSNYLVIESNAQIIAIPNGQIKSIHKNR